MSNSQPKNNHSEKFLLEKAEMLVNDCRDLSVKDIIRVGFYMRRLAENRDAFRHDILADEAGNGSNLVCIKPENGNQTSGK